MLKHAIIYTEQLKELMIKATTDSHYKYYFNSNYNDYNFVIYENDWNTIQRVSVDSNGNIIGYMSCCIRRDSRII